MYSAVFLIYFISTAVILLVPLASMDQFPQPYNKAGEASVLYNFILVFFKAFCGLNTLLIMPVITEFVINIQFSFKTYRIS